MEKKLIDITWDKGFNGADADSILGEGEAAELKNWYPYRGGLKARLGWVSGSTSGGLPAERVGRGITKAAWGAFGSETRYMLAAHGDAGGTGTYQFFRSSVDSSGDPTGAWTRIYRSGGSDQTSDIDAIWPVAMCTASSDSATYMFVSSFGFGGTYDDVAYITGTGTDMTPLIGSASGTERARALAVFADSLCVGGSALFPTRLWLSDIGDPITFSGVARSLEVGYGDGYPIEDLTLATGQLAIGKRSGVWMLSGAGMDTFDLDKLDGDMSAAPGRSLCNTPKGLVIAGHDAVWMYDSECRRISDVLDGVYSVDETNGYVSTAYQNGLLYVCVSNGDTFVYDMENQAWWKEAQTTTAEGPNFVFSTGDRYLHATPVAATSNSIGMYRSLATITPARDANTGEQFKATTPLIFFGDGQAQVEARHAYLQLRQVGTATDGTSLLVRVLDESGTEICAEEHGLWSEAPYVRRIRLDFGGDREAAQLEFSHTLGSSHSTIYEVEKIQVVANVSEIR